MRLPDDLIDAFKVADGQIRESLAVLVVDDSAERSGWDAEAVRLLGAWLHAEVRWEQPKVKCPDNFRVSSRSWGWLWSGARFDYAEVGAAAGVSRAIARAKLAVLISNHLIYPDGTISQNAKAVLASHIARRLKRAAKPPEPTNTN